MKRLDDWPDAYARALASLRWSEVDPLVHDDVRATFSDGLRHLGRAAVRAAFERNFAAIRDEPYAISNLRWPRRGTDHAVCLFDFAWSGVVGGRPAGGAGRGTTALLFESDRWLMIAEHLGPKPPD
jgi:hypothetical protein